MTLDVADLPRLKVKDLQRELKKRGLDTSGLKAVLVVRLKEHLQQETEASSEAEAEPEQQEKELKDVAEDDKKEEVDSRGEERKYPHSHAEEEASMEEAPETQAARTSDSSAKERDINPAGVKRGVDAVESDEKVASSDAKKRKLEEEVDKDSPQPEDEDNDKLRSRAEPEHNGEAAEPTEGELMTTLRIDNFVRPFTLNAVKTLVQEFGSFVENGFWMDVIKTHCFVTYPETEIAKKTSAALDGKIWPPENGRALHVVFAEQTAMEVSEHGESNKVSTRSKNKVNSDSEAQSNQRKKVTIDEFFLKTETKPVLYYLPLTDEQVQQRKQRQPQEGQTRNKRRHRGGRKNRNRGRFQRR
ncbi:Apoptotic chromatin condensation inducer in the nucleus [Phytophthora boehmeriae]|uniref:Apoptotic chromatin condensation inducer in the nucleus n=1 Tax=Phytophthora boehmeriae TaxID=109152 RepID=A0A8T1X501_9STRA|nr:Apoptotic chromatin condensation inducer in the nucleus [Phytophthora boehmeriae]